MSRQIAALLTPDTLTSRLEYIGEDGHKLTWPRTVLFDDRGDVYVSDSKRNSVFIFEANGTLRNEFTWQDASAPYLAGWREDTLLVFNPREKIASIDFFVDTARVHSVTIPDAPRGALQYASATASSLYLKVVTQADTHFVLQLNHQGEIMARTELLGESWDHAGFIRSYNDELFSLTGFFPRLMAWPDGFANAPITIRLRGFDSPMLRRTYAYTQGSGRGAPLLTSSAVQANGYWFVLNLRPGWLRVDVYDATGQLQYILVERDPGYLKEFYPLDIAVRSIADDTYDIAVSLVATPSVVRRYTWKTQQP